MATNVPLVCVDDDIDAIVRRTAADAGCIIDDERDPVIMGDLCDCLEMRISSFGLPTVSASMARVFAVIAFLNSSGFCGSTKTAWRPNLGNV